MFNGLLHFNMHQLQMDQLYAVVDIVLERGTVHAAASECPI